MLPSRTHSAPCGSRYVRILLKPLTKIKGRQVSSYMPNIAKDLSLNTSMAKKQQSICGAIGGKCSITDASSIYHVNMISGHFLFDEPPCSGDLNNLTGSLPQATYSVRKASIEPILQGPNLGRKPDDDPGDNHQPPPRACPPPLPLPDLLYLILLPLSNQANVCISNRIWIIRRIQCYNCCQISNQASKISHPMAIKSIVFLKFFLALQ